MRCRLLFAFAFFGGLAAAPASARYGYCEVRTFAADRILLSGSMDVGEDGENRSAIRNDFAVAMNRPVNRVECDFSKARAYEAEEQRQRKIAAKLEPIEDTGWTGRFAATASVEKPKPSGAFISVKDNGIAARTKAWDDAVLQGRRDEAQRRVRDARPTSPNDPKFKALVAAFMERLRRRGRSQ